IRGQVQFTATVDNPNARRSIAFGSTGTVPASSYTDAQGRFSLPVLPGPGWLCVTARDADSYPPAELKGQKGQVIPGLPRPIIPGYHHAVVKIDTDEAKPDSLRIDIRLQPARSRAGKVVGPDGKPLAGCFAAGLAPLGRDDGR